MRRSELALGGAAALTALLVLLSAATTASAQQPDAASICVIPFSDLNKNGVREDTEPLTSNVNATLMIGDVTIGNLWIGQDQGQQYCFRNLAPGPYIVAFSTQTGAPTTLAIQPITAQPGQALGAPFGVAPLEAKAPSQSIAIPLTRPIRIMMACGGSLVIMLLCLGFGLVLRSLYLLLRRNTPAM